MRQSRSLSTVHRLTAAAAENSAARSFVRFPEAHAGTSGAFSGLSGALTSITLVFLSILFTGLEWYDRIAQHAGAGTLVPITGFANAVASPALDFKSEGFVLGLGAKMFVIAGPVIVYGISASVVYGIIYYIVGLFTK